MVVLAIGAAAVFAFGVLLDPLVEEHGWSRGAISFAYSLRFLVGIPTVLVAGISPLDRLLFPDYILSGAVTPMRFRVLARTVLVAATSLRRALVRVSSEETTRQSR